MCQKFLKYRIFGIIRGCGRILSTASYLCTYNLHGQHPSGLTWRPERSTYHQRVRDSTFRTNSETLQTAIWAQIGQETWPRSACVILSIRSRAVIHLSWSAKLVLHRANWADSYQRGIFCEPGYFRRDEE